ncbi:IQ calmodulin-binding domain-containing protein domain-containing protein [Pleurostoma richardsiae]|uniref:IQ calmodulin-binding domain-containing protein domain-containing protein n=1 Tax=Pleurostoma richardsiae TaxID=41990 RepID=A0AA38RIN0_9PEZI|nr:IQ calmodulin-binding domain-containing protein domain-containing protein [Pleurostoma richardsiae]
MRRPSLDLTEPSRNLEESLGSPAPGSLDPTVDMSLSPDEEIEAVEGPQDDGPQIFSPPPHIAARFYRPTQNRRKDSAASSRRNSISSQHSRSSHGFGRDGGPQSKHIAQHLRRASILEDRQKRLADRAAHAEKVRLRAALAKASIRDASVFEEKALAAQLARERNLAEIAAACAEEVKRAKAVAESMKEKREQEIQKMRMQMEERLAEAERRREELRNKNALRTRGRGQSTTSPTRKAVEVLPEVEEVKERETSPLTEDAAVARIQWWWRGMERKKAVSEFLQLGLTIDSVRDTSFEKVVELLGQEKVLLITARVLRICGLQEGETGSVEEMAAVRTFLSAFLILGHPAQVLSNRDGSAEQEQELVAKARDLLISFETILSRLTSTNNYTPPQTLLQALPEVYATFYNAFIAWKARDSSALIDVMLLQFVELDAILHTVKDSTDAHVTDQYRQSIQENQVKLLVRIKKLAGAEQGKKLVLEAVRKARKARAQKKPVGDMKPRIADQSMTAESALDDLGTAQEASSSGAQQPTPPATPVGKQRSVEIDVRLPRKASLLPDNRIVVHELAINNEYRVSAEEWTEAETKMLRPLLDEMRDTMQDDHQERHFYLLLAIADSIRDKLQRLVRPGNSMHTFIGEMLDIDVAKRQFLTGSFSYEKFFSSMGALLPKLCAPIRDDEVKDLVENHLTRGNYVDRLEALMLFIDVMLSDYANHLLHMVAPKLLESAPQYEAKVFTAALENGEHGLSSAEAAWRVARSKVLGEVSRRDPEGINHPKSRPSADRFYTQMLVDVFTQLSPPSLEDVPEMLRLDHKRILKSGQLTRRIITTSGILLQCKNLLKRDVRAPWKTEAARIMTVLQSADQEQASTEAVVAGVMAALEAGRSMPAATKGHLRALVQKLVTASKDCTAPSDSASGSSSDPREPVLRLLLNRLRGHLMARLAPGSASDKVKATSTAGEKLAGLGLAEFVETVREMVDEMAKVGAVDRETHGVWWENVAEKVEREEQEASAAGTSTPATAPATPPSVRD